MPLALRDYQQDALSALDCYWEQGTRPLIVAPTGSGKSLLIAEFINRTLTESSDIRIIVAVHTQELVRQNHDEFLKLCPNVDTGIYSAGLSRREVRQVTFANIQSICDRGEEWGKVAVLIVDEAHRIPPKDGAQYQKLIATLRENNHALAVIGLTATPYRLDSGRLDEGEDAVFDGVAHETPVVKLVKDGYLSPLSTKGGIATIDLSSVRVLAGEFSARDLERAADIPALVHSSVREIIAYGQNRRSWLIFCSGINHARSVGEAFSLYGVSAEVLTSATPQKDRQSIIARFVAGEIRCLANVAVLTTGFNAPQTDLIALLTATKSASKYVQILGRGMRIAPDKADCLVLDYGGNVERFGPVESVEPLRKGSDGKKRTPYKTCPECREHVPTGVRVCPSCGHEFPRPSPALYPEASSAKAYRGLDFTEPCWVQVDDVLIGRHRKPLKPDSIKMTFLTEIGQIRHWLTLDHSPHSKRISSRYVFLAGGKANNTEDALAEADSWNVPSQILVQKSGRWFRVLKFRFEKETI